MDSIILLPIVLAITFWIIHSKEDRKRITGSVAQASVSMASAVVTVTDEANYSLEHMSAMATIDRTKELADAQLSAEDLAKAEQMLELLTKKKANR